MTTRSGPGHGRPDPDPEVISPERRQLINVSCRLLFSLTDAEEAVQETYARRYAMTAQQQDAIASPGAWLTTVTSRIWVDPLGSARARRETYTGLWLPERLPVSVAWIGGLAGTAADPADRVTLDESVNMAFLKRCRRVGLLTTQLTYSTSRLRRSSVQKPDKLAHLWSGGGRLGRRANGTKLAGARIDRKSHLRTSEAEGSLNDGTFRHDR